MKPKCLGCVEGLQRYKHRLSCVYFLCHEGIVVYIGMSTDFRLRYIEQKHRFIHDTVFIVEAEPTQLRDLERFYIQLLEPVWNAVGLDTYYERSGLPGMSKKKRFHLALQKQQRV